VEVTTDTTATEQVFAQPDGSFAATTTTHPVRVWQGSGWVPVDTTLRRNGDGSYSPIAATTPITFSGGGSGPLVTLGGPGQSVSFTWPTALPTPTISGDTALYPAVMAGVDLRLRASAESYSEVLTVHDATAAANPALAHLTLNVTADGLSLTAAPDGQISATDTSGVEVFHGATPVVWDSASDPQTGTAPTAGDPGSGKVSTVGVNLVGNGAPPGGPARLTLTPAATALTGPGVSYPVYFDPGMTGAKQHFAVVTSSGWHYYDDTTEDAKVGDCEWAGCNGIGVARSYFAMNTATITGRSVTATIHSVDFSITETHNATNCTAQPVALHRSPSFTSGITWGGPAGVALQTVSANFGDLCATAPANNLNFTGSAVVSYLQEAANNDWTSVSFALIAPNESDRNQWKRFATNPTLTIHYNFPPSVPTGLKVSNAVSCSGKVYTADAFPSLFATGHDNNPSPLQLNMWFELWPTGGSARTAWNTAGVKINSNTQGSWPVNKPGGVGNANWSYRVHAENLPSDVPHLSSAWSGWYEFVSRAIPPATAPSVTSYDYPYSGYWGSPTASSPTFMLTANGSPDVVGFSYSWAGAGTEPALKTTDCNYNQTIGNGGLVAASSGNATLPVPTSLAPGYHTLYVRGFDDAHNLSPESSAYNFYVAPNLGVTRTRLEPTDSTQVTLGQPAGQSVALGPQTGNPQFWSAGSQELFQGTAVNQSFTMAFNTPAGPGGVPLEADYALGAKTIMGANYGQLRFDLDDVPLAGTDTQAIDGYNSGSATRFVRFGGAHLTAGTHTLKVTLVGKNAASTGFNAGVDYLTLVPFNNVTAASFTAAMNNRGLATDGTSAADFDIGSGDTALSKPTLAAAGYGPNTTLAVGGATFTMPAPNATTGNDNVIAAGQTIPLPAAQQVKATAVGLLTVATCGATPNTRGAVTYTDGTLTRPAYISVPDWAFGPAAAAAVVLDHRDIGTSPDTAIKPRIYAVFLPTDPTKTLRSVTLPNIGTSFLPASCPRALHVLAMAPRPVNAGWIGTWAATAEAAAAPVGGTGLANQTLRLVVHPTATGGTARIRLSNTFAATPVTLDRATIAAQSGTAAATRAAPAALTFCAAAGQAAGCGARTLTLAAGAEAYSDPIAFPDTSGGSGNLAVSLHLPTAVAAAPVHTAGNTTNYLAAGDATADQTGTGYATTTTNSYYLTAVDVSTADATQGTIAILGDHTSATGAPGGTYQPTWVDDLPAKLGSNLPGGLVNASLAASQPTTWWRAGETGAPLNQTILDEPNLRTVLVTLGADDILQNIDPATIEQNLTNLINGPSAAYSIRHYQRTDGTQIHVILATVPPLGLATTDQREINRQTLNNHVRNNFGNLGANEVIDYDAAVRDPAHASNINPLYLTAGTPNATYYNTLAQALTDAVETFPPTAQL
jgi:hypothetical protein